ncbi:MAG: HD domain-containing protein [Lachnospiraceae bacterium]|nr:HD domain-containing protein [Lachnospiraceae bacterium]
MSNRNFGYTSKKTVFWSVIMFLLMMGSAVAVPYLKEGGQALRPLYLILAGGLALGAAVFVCCFEARACESYLFWLIPLVYLISVAFMLLFDRPFAFPLWTFGGIFVLCAFKLRYGMFLNIFLLYILGSMQTELVSEVLIVQLICLVLFGFVMPNAKSWKDAVNVLVSVAAVLISVRIVCYFTMDRTSLTNDIFSVSVVYAIVVCAVLLLARAFRETAYMQGQAESFEFLEELAAGAELQDANVSEYIAMTEGDTFTNAPVYDRNVFDAVRTVDNTRMDAEDFMRLQALSEESAPLLTRFSQKYPKAFLHARRVALFATEVAEHMDGVNAILVKCGGYYHEIGRLRGEKTLANTLSVAQEENFPVALQEVLHGHTVDGDKPASKEAALLLLTDNICGMCEHLKKTQKGKIVIVKVIEKAINLRLTKGDLSYSGLTAADLTVIRNTMAEVIKEDMF